MPQADYEIRRAQRLARMRERAEQKRKAAVAAREAGKQMQSYIPFGQPILVGHHSESKHRNMLKRIDANYRRSMQEATEAAQLERRIAAAESAAAISADDPHAIERYRAKAAVLEREIAAMKAANRWIRASNAMSDQEIADKLAEQGHVLTAAADAIARARRPPFGKPGFSTTNTAAELRRVRARIAELEVEASRVPTPPTTIGRATLTECPEDNRMRITFPARISEEECALMRSAGFVWSPRAQAWQRKLNANARAAARRVAEQLAKQAAE